MALIHRLAPNFKRSHLTGKEPKRSSSIFQHAHVSSAHRESRSSRVIRLPWDVLRLSATDLLAARFWLVCLPPPPRAWGSRPVLAGALALRCAAQRPTGRARAKCTRAAPPNGTSRHIARTPPPPSPRRELPCPPLRALLAPRRRRRYVVQLTLTSPRPCCSAPNANRTSHLHSPTEPKRPVRKLRAAKRIGHSFASSR